MATTLCTTPAGQSRKRSYLDDTPPSCKRLRASSSAALFKLRQLFPHMDDATLTNVLDSCAHNIDLAVEQLRVPASGLHLTATAAASPSTLTARSPSPEAPAADQQNDGPKTPAAWVDAIVAEMSRSRDVTDARDRAARALAAFEAFVMSRRVPTKNTPDDGHMSKLKSENAVLKRAVAIQAQRLGEATETCKKQAAEIERLEMLAHDQREKLRQAEHTNYSLSVHLRHATDDAAFSGLRHPDVY